MCMFVTYAGALRGQNSYPDPLEIELYIVASHLRWVLRTIFKSAGSVASILLRYLPFPVYASFDEFSSPNVNIFIQYILLICDSSSKTSLNA